MAKKSERPPGTPETSGPIAPQQRVRIVLERLFAGNQSEMGRALGCTPAAISQIVRERRGVGGGILRALATLPGVSPDWAILGLGAQPAVLGRPTRESLFLPVVSSLDFTLSGRPPQAHTSMAKQVAQLDFSPTRLIFQVAEGHPCL